jgi:hypothetical protein
MADCQAMQTQALDFNLDQVLPFVQNLLPGMRRCEDMKAIGLRKNGALVAGVLYEGFNGRNTWIHVAAQPGSKWLVRDYLRACFGYPFVVCGVDRLTGYVDEKQCGIAPLC